jgi:hypothetical protein
MFISAILACCIVTFVLDALRHPKGSKQFMWRHWWHTPLLAYLLILIVVFIPPIADQAAGFYGGIITAGALVSPFMLWMFLTSGDPFVLPSASTGKRSVLRTANMLLIAGTLCSFIILSLSLLIWLTSLLLIGVLAAGVLAYFIGFLLRVSTTVGKRPEER